MTDPKPATPDHEILVLQGRITLALQRISAGYAPMRIPAQLTDPDLVLSDCAARIAADEETVRKQAEEIEAKEQEIRGLMFEKTPMLLTIDIANQELATARAQMETLREALIRLRDCDWVISLPDRMDAVRDIARAALAATEPKG